MKLRSTAVLGALVLLVASSAPARRHAAPTVNTDLYRVTPLKGFPGAQNSVAFAINDRGQVVGQANDNGHTHAVLWDNGALIDIGVLPDNEGSFGRGLNNRGDVTGRSEGGHRSTFPAVVWSRSTGLRELPLLPGDNDGFAYAVNDAGQTVGWSQGKTGRRAVLWDGEGIHDLENEAHFREGGAYAVNAHGQIVGEDLVEEPHRRPETDSGPSGGNYFVPFYYHAFLWERGKVIDLGVPLTYKNSTATALSDAGQVVGYAVRSTEDQTTRAFIWQGGSMRLLPTPPGQHSRANGINNRSQIVGYVGDFRKQAQSFAWKTRAALWQNDRLIDLNTLILSDSGWLLTEANGINDRGQIVGVGRWNGERRAFLLTPIR